MPRNARFWESHNGSWVKLTLRPGEYLFTREGGATDEGYSVTNTEYHYDGKTVTRESHNSARDCDGQTSHTTLTECRVRKLASRAPYTCRYFVATAKTPYDEDYCPALGALLPAWERVSQSQRDYAAEAAGY